MFGTPSTLTSTMLDLVAQAVAAGEVFYGRDLANRAKRSGVPGNEGDMTHVVRQAYLQGLMPGYEVVEVIKEINARGDTHPVFMYQPAGTPAEVTRQHAARKVAALPPAGSTPPKGPRVPDGTIVGIVPADDTTPASTAATDSMVALSILGGHIVDDEDEEDGQEDE